MTNKILIILLAVLPAIPLQSAQAGNAAQKGVLGGAAGGAIIGQAIGRNTEATLIGTAVGGMLGYILGNEVDKSGGRVVRYNHTTYQSPPTREMRQQQAICRPTEVLATIDGRPEKVYATACLEDGRWVLVDDYDSAIEQTVIIDREPYYAPQINVYDRGHYPHRPKHYRKKYKRHCGPGYGRRY